MAGSRVAVYSWLYPSRRLRTCALVEVSPRRGPSHGDGITGPAPLEKHEVSDLSWRQDVAMCVVHDLERSGTCCACKVPCRREEKRPSVQMDAIITNECGD